MKAFLKTLSDVVLALLTIAVIAALSIWAFASLQPPARIQAQPSSCGERFA